MQNLPEKFLERLKRLYSEEKLEQVLHAIQTKPLPSFRANPLKISANLLREKLEQAGFQLEPVNWYKDAFILKNKSVRELTETEEYKQGKIYIQNLSSMIPALVLNPKPDEKILDLCAAPGSKTTQIAALMQNKGEIVANDLSRQRLYKMESILNLYGIPFQKINPNVIARNEVTKQSQNEKEIAALPLVARNDKNIPIVLITNLPGERIWQKYPEYFDKTLVDVPCSMEGRIRLDDPETYKDWKLGKIKGLERTQQYLLRSAISSTKVGGIIVYSTCTLAPEENEGVIDWILKKEGNAIEIEKIEIPNLELNPGIEKWNKPFHPLINLTARIQPSKNMEGFFVAKIRKIASTIQL